MSQLNNFLFSLMRSSSLIIKLIKGGRRDPVWMEYACLEAAFFKKRGKSSASQKFPTEEKVSGRLQGNSLDERRKGIRVQRHLELTFVGGMSERKKTWAELREEVRGVRRWLWGLSYRLPHSFAIRAKENGHFRVYFMSSPPNSKDNSLYAVDIPKHPPPLPPNQAPSLTYPWIRLLAADFQVILYNAQFLL